MLSTVPRPVSYRIAVAAHVSRFCQATAAYEIHVRYGRASDFHVVLRIGAYGQTQAEALSKEIAGFVSALRWRGRDAPAMHMRLALILEDGSRRLVAL